MKSISFTIVMLMILQSGCSMCCGPFDYDYPAFGGKHLRADRSHGRVGSILSDPMTSVAGPSSDSNLEAPPELKRSDTDEDDFFDDDTMTEELEGIEPLKDKDTLRSPERKSTGDSTASRRWRPKPLR